MQELLGDGADPFTGGAICCVHSFLLLHVRSVEVPESRPSDHDHRTLRNEEGVVSRTFRATAVVTAVTAVVTVVKQTNATTRSSDEC